jgi:hypothetical protein
MTCRGYDAKAVKVPKSVKSLFGQVVDKTQRKAFIRSHAKILESELRVPGGKK